MISSGKLIRTGYCLRRSGETVLRLSDSTSKDSDTLPSSYKSRSPTEQGVALHTAINDITAEVHIEDQLWEIDFDLVYRCAILKFLFDFVTDQANGNVGACATATGATVRCDWAIVTRKHLMVNHLFKLFKDHRMWSTMIGPVLVVIL